MARTHHLLTVFLRSSSPAGACSPASHTPPDDAHALRELRADLMNVGATRPDPGQIDRSYRSAMSDRPDAARDADAERWLDLDVKLAYQERLIRELDALVRELGDRLAKAERELAELRQAMPPPVPLGPIHEPPPHY